MAPGEPLIRKLFLLHPKYRTVLLELASTTDTTVTSAGESRHRSDVLNTVEPVLMQIPPPLTVSYQEHQKDASYITVSCQPTPDSEPSARIVKSMSLRAAIGKAQIVRVGESNKTGTAVKPGALEVNKFFRRLSFKRQVRTCETSDQVDEQDSVSTLTDGNCLCVSLSSDESPWLPCVTGSGTTERRLVKHVVDRLCTRTR